MSPAFFEYLRTEFSRLSLYFLCLHLESTISPRTFVSFQEEIIVRNQNLGIRYSHCCWDVIFFQIISMYSWDIYLQKRLEFIQVPPISFITTELFHILSIPHVYLFLHCDNPDSKIYHFIYSCDLWQYIFQIVTLIVLASATSQFKVQKYCSVFLFFRQYLPKIYSKGTVFTSDLITFFLYYQFNLKLGLFVSVCI